jgi:hypothetical protein
MAGVVETTNTFATNDIITSTAMNNIIDQTLFTSDAIAAGNTTLVLVAGKLKVGTITSNEMGTGAVTANAIASDAVTTTKILDANVTTAKIADSNVTTAKILDANVTTAKILDANVTTAKIADASITPAKLNGAQTGSDPIYGTRAFARVASNGTATRNVGFATISRTGSGTYSLILTNTPSSDPIITATTHTGGVINHADVQINTSTSFTVRTGNPLNTSDSSFSVMVIY